MADDRRGGQGYVEKELESNVSYHHRLGSTVALAEYRRINVLNDRLGCAATWLDRAKGSHANQMSDPANFTEGSMRKLMDSLDSAYTCATKDPSSGHAPGAGAFGQYGVLPQK